MANPLTFLRPLRYDKMHAILLVQSGPTELALRVAERLRTIAPGCEIDLVVREDDREAAADGGFAHVLVVRWEDRVEVVRLLRRHRYDVVAVLLSRHGSDYLRVLPYLLRTRAVLAFNDNADGFPVHATRVATLAFHLSGRDSVGALLRWAIGRAALGGAAFCVLVASTLRLQARAARRRARGARGLPA
jgi:hypothetical protein